MNWQAGKTDLQGEKEAYAQEEAKRRGRLYGREGERERLWFWKSLNFLSHSCTAFLEFHPHQKTKQNKTNKNKQTKNPYTCVHTLKTNINSSWWFNLALLYLWFVTKNVLIYVNSFFKDSKTCDYSHTNTQTYPDMYGTKRHIPFQNPGEHDTFSNHV